MKKLKFLSIFRIYLDDLLTETTSSIANFDIQINGEIFKQLPILITTLTKKVVLIKRK
jgi:hypothetical protein